jgi:hypothetical protein
MIQCKSYSLHGCRCTKEALYPIAKRPWERPKLCAHHWRHGKRPKAFSFLAKPSEPEKIAEVEPIIRERLQGMIKAIDEAMKRRDLNGI